jgi:hypothetical protein
VLPAPGAMLPSSASGSCSSVMLASDSTCTEIMQKMCSQLQCVSFSDTSCQHQGPCCHKCDKCQRLMKLSDVGQRLDLRTT